MKQAEKEQDEYLMDEQQSDMSTLEKNVFNDGSN